MSKIPVTVKIKEEVEFIELNGVPLKAYPDGRLERWTGKRWIRCSDKANRDGYIRSTVGGRPLLRHRIIYFAFNRSWDIWDSSQDNLIDHIDGNKVNNNLSNLRVATNSQNLCNRGMQIDNRCGHKNICAEYNKKRDTWYWTIAVKCNGKTHTMRFEVGKGPVPYILPPVPEHIIEHAKLMREQYHGDFSNQ